MYIFFNQELLLL